MINPDLKDIPTRPPKPLKRVNPDILPQTPEETQKLISDGQVKTWTDDNDRANDEVAYKRWSREAHKERKKAFEMGGYVRIAEELANHKPGEPLSVDAATYLERGGSVPALLTAISEYMTYESQIGKVGTIVDDELDQARKEWVLAAMKRPGILHRGQKKQDLATSQERYTDAFLAKLKIIADTPGNGDALSAGYIPQIVEKMSFGPDINRTLEDLAGNHLHVLVDQLLREELYREGIVDSTSFKGAKKVTHALKTNKLLRGVIAGAIFTAAATGAGSENLGIAKPVGDAANEGLRYLAAYFASRGLLEGSYESVSGMVDRRRRRGELERLASDKTLTDLSLKTVYNEVESRVPDRKGTDDSEENLRRFGNIDEDFIRLRTAPQGKPFSGEEVLDYCAKLYIERKPEVDRILSGDDPAKTFYDLSSVMLTEDLSKLRDKLMIGKTRRIVFRGVSALASLVANHFTLVTTGVFKEAKGLPKEVIPDLTPKPL